MGGLTSRLLSGLLVLARVGGALAFVPLPGVRQGPSAARAALIVTLTVALYPAWPAPPAAWPDAALLAGWLLSEAALGLTVGLAVSFLNEAFLVAAQIFGLQAGYSYAATVDPATEADSNVLLVFAQFMAGLLFFALGLHLEVVRVFARSLETYPPGAYGLTPARAEAVLKLGAAMFSQGLRLALPVVALLVLADATLALLGRIHAHLQLLMLAFPVKMLGALAMLGATAALYPKLYRAAAEETFRLLVRLLAGHGG
jgi:flagellar biosynthetic protein FliR